MDNYEAVLPDAVTEEHIGNGLGDGDDPVGARPIPGTLEMKINSAGDYERRSRKGRTNAGQGQGVRIMSVEDRYSAAEFLEDGPDHPGVEPGTPRCGMHPDPRAF
jgi:hypothetical protein